MRLDQSEDVLVEGLVRAINYRLSVLRYQESDGRRQLGLHDFVVKEDGVEMFELHGNSLVLLTRSNPDLEVLVYHLRQSCLHEFFRSEQVHVVALVQLLTNEQTVGLVQFQSKRTLHFNEGVAGEHQAEAGLADEHFATLY